MNIQKSFCRAKTKVDSHFKCCGVFFLSFLLSYCFGPFIHFMKTYKSPKVTRKFSRNLIHSRELVQNQRHIFPCSSLYCYCVCVCTRFNYCSSKVLELLSIEEHLCILCSMEGTRWNEIGLRFQSFSYMKAPHHLTATPQWWQVKIAFTRKPK